MKLSAGILLYKKLPFRMFLVHPGGPLWAKKDEGVWSIPKGEYNEGDDPTAAAIREFTEETGTIPVGDLIPLGSVNQSKAKRVTAFALEGDIDPVKLVSNKFTMEWPRGSGKIQEFPEIDRGEWFTLPVVIHKILPGQRPLIEKLASIVFP
jgi:predicted NUDIX family NTP pyrophosphohydrolase